MTKFFKEHGFLALLIVAAVFAFPMKTGIKPDAAIYTAIAKNIVDTGQWWPLRVSVNLFPEFYEHPPGVLWAMALVMHLFGEHSLWVAALFSRLCTLGVFALGVWAIHRSMASRAKLVSFLFVLFLLSWGQFLKYAGSAQLEGPSALLVLAWFALMFQPPRWAFFWGFAVGALAMLCKGMLFVPLVALSVLSPLAHRKTNWQKLHIGLLLGFFSGVGILAWLDFFNHSAFQSYYWNRLVSWTTGSQKHEALSIADRIWGFIRGELKYALLWSLPFWILGLTHLTRLFTTKPLQRVVDPITFSFCFYLVFVAPFVVAAIKMPHWPVPVYPVCAIALAMLTSRWAERYWSEKIERALYATSLALVLALAVLPLGNSTSPGRGEEWAYNARVIQQNGKALLISDLSHRHYPDKVYAALYLGPNFVIQHIKSSELKDLRCDSQLFLLHDEQFAEFSPVLAQTNWQQLPHRGERASLWACKIFD